MSHILRTPQNVRNTLEPAEVASNSSGSRSVRTILAAGKDQKNLESKREIIDRLKNCHDLKDIRKLSVSLKLDLSSTPLYSKSAFSHLLGTQCSFDEIIKFLEDSSFNSPEARNLDALLKWYARYSDRDRDKILPDWITRRISQGILHGEELLSFVQTISSLTGEVEFDDGSGSFSRIIFNGLSSSTVFAFHDVNRILLRELLGSLTLGAPSPEKLSLGVEIIKCSSPSQFYALRPVITWFLNSCLMPQNWQQEVQLFDPKPVSKILEFLLKAPLSFKAKSIREATSTLLIHHECPSENLSVLLNNLEQWWALLSAYGMFKDLSQSVEWVLFERKLARQDVRILASYLRLFSHQQICCFLLRNWFAPEIGNHATRRIGEPQPFEEKFKANMTLAQDKFSPFVVMVQSLGQELSSNSKWILSLFSLLRELGDSRAIIQIVLHRRRLGLPISLAAVINEINEQSNKRPSVAFRLFKSTPNITLETCPSVAKIMICHPRFNPATAQWWRYQRQQFHAPHQNYFREPQDIFGEWGRGNFPPHESEPVRQSRAFLLETMAMAYAEAPHLFASVAWREVIRCWKLHQRYCLGPMGLGMSRALVISGVIRRLQEYKWVSPIRIRWILRIVSEIEGEGIASELDRSMYDWRQKMVERNDHLEERRRRWRDMGIEEDKPRKRDRPRDDNISEWRQGMHLGGRRAREFKNRELRNRKKPRLMVELMKNYERQAEHIMKITLSG